MLMIKSDSGDKEKRIKELGEKYWILEKGFELLNIKVV